MPRPLSRWFMNAAQTEDEEDPYTRNTSPRTRPSPAERTTSQPQQPQQRSRSRRPLSMPSTIFTLAPGRARPSFPAVFNIVRFSIYAAVLAWTFICLAIAAHFNTLLQPSELTSFIPLAIFVSVASMIIFVVLIGFTLWKKDMNPISARIELGCLGLAGTLWLALGALMVSSDAQMADVECFASEDETEPVELPGFTTETFQAQYRVLEAFALFSAILIWAFFLFVLFLILRRRSQGNPHVWFQPVTDLPWTEGAGKEGKLPAPVTARSRTQSRPSPPEKDSRNPNKASASSTPATTPGVTPRGEAGLLWMPHIPKNNGTAANANTATSTNQHSAQNAAALAGYGYGGTARPPPRAYQGSYDRNDTAARRQDSQRSTDSQGRGRSTDKWGRAASPRRNDSTRSVERAQPAGATTVQRGRSQPRRDDSQRSNQAPRREDSSRSRPARGDSQRSQQPRQESRTRAVTREDSQRSQQQPRREDSSRSRPARGDSQRSQQQQQPRREESRNRTMTREDSSRSRPAREDSQRSRPVREDSQRSRPARGDSQRSQPRRDDSQRSRPQREDSQRTQRSATGGWYREAATRK